MKQYEEEVRKGGGVFFDVRHDDVYFTDPQTDTTLMLKANDCTPEAVAKKLAVSREKFLEGEKKLHSKISESLSYALYPRRFPDRVITDCADAVLTRIEIFKEMGK